MSIERAALSGAITETKEATDENGVPIGIVKGHLATWQMDAYPGIYGVRLARIERQARVARFA